MPRVYDRNIAEIKDQYTTFLINILTPLIYEGIKTLYDAARNGKEDILRQIEEERNAGNNRDYEIDVIDVHELFLIYLKGIPMLEDDEVMAQMDKIKRECGCYDWFDDLVRAVVKSNIVLLTYNTSGSNCELVEDKYHEKIDIKEFIHKCYIECARAIFNNPELFWCEFEPIELKRNKRDALEIIRRSIGEAIRKMLPMKLILMEYLKNDYIVDDDKNLSTNVSKAEYENVKSMVEKDKKEEESESSDREHSPKRNGFEDVSTHQSTRRVDEHKKLEDALRDRQESTESDRQPIQTNNPQKELMAQLVPNENPRTIEKVTENVFRASRPEKVVALSSERTINLPRMIRKAEPPQLENTSDNLRVMTIKSDKVVDVKERDAFFNRMTK